MSKTPEGDSQMNRNDLIEPGPQISFATQLVAFREALKYLRDQLRGGKGKETEQPPAEGPISSPNQSRRSDSN